MNESEFQSMLSRAQQKKAEAQELARAHSDKRQGLLAKAIQSNRVVVDWQEVPGEFSANELRQRFDQDMNRLMRQAAAATPPPTDEAE